MVWTVSIGEQPLRGLATTLRDLAKLEVGDDAEAKRQTEVAVTVALEIARSGAVGEEPFHVTLTGCRSEGSESPTISVGVSGTSAAEKALREAAGSSALSDVEKRVLSKGGREAGLARIAAAREERFTRQPDNPPQ